MSHSRRNTKSLGEISTGQSSVTEFAHVADRVIGQLRVWVCRSVCRAIAPPALVEHVVHVLSVGGDKEVVRIEAGSHVTGVGDFHLFGNRPVVNFPRQAVDAGASPIDLQLPVAVTANASRPQPTLAGLIRAGLKAFFDCSSDILSRHGGSYPLCHRPGQCHLLPALPTGV